MIFAAGDHVNARRYNSMLSGVLPCRVGPRTDSVELTFVEEKGATLLPKGPSGLQQAKARKRVMLECQSGVQLRWSDGAPALAIADIGRGRSAFLATTLDDEWTDLPLRPGYLPLLSRLIREVARTRRTVSGPVAAGSKVELDVPPDAARMEVLAPDGAVHRFDDLRDKVQVDFEATNVAGPYRVLAQSGRGAMLDVPRGAFIVEAPRSESDLHPLAGVEGWNTRGDRSGAGAQVRRSLAPWLLIAFAMLVLAEGALRLRTR